MSLPNTIAPTFPRLRKSAYLALGLLVLVTALGGCSQKNNSPIMLDGATMGTSWSLTYWTQTETQSAEQIRQTTQLALDDVDNMMSTYKTDSALSQFNHSLSTNWQSVPDELVAVIGIAQELSNISDGAYDISIAPLVDLWGFGPASIEQFPPSAEAIQARLEKVGFDKLEIRQSPAQLRKTTHDLQLDLSSIAKGFGLDQAVSALRALGLTDFLLEVGGEIYAAGLRADGSPWRIAIEHPDPDVPQPIRIIPVSNLALATSGDYRNVITTDAGEHYAHTINPKTGYPVSHDIASVTVISANATLADGWATALLSLEPDRAIALAEEHQLTALFIRRSGESYQLIPSSAFASFAPLAP